MVGGEIVPVDVLTLLASLVFPSIGLLALASMLGMVLHEKNVYGNNALPIRDSWSIARANSIPFCQGFIRTLTEMLG